MTPLKLKEESVQLLEVVVKLHFLFQEVQQKATGLYVHLIMIITMSWLALKV
jgi:hypothetical protein